METTRTKTKRQSHPDRITLNSEALGRVNNWLEVVATKAQTIKVGRSDLVNFLLLKRFPEITPEEIKELEGLHFDPVRFLALSLKEAKKAQAKGEKVSTSKLLQGLPPSAL